MKAMDEVVKDSRNEEDRKCNRGGAKEKDQRREKGNEESGGSELEKGAEGRTQVGAERTGSRNNRLVKSEVSE